MYKADSIMKQRIQERQLLLSEIWKSDNFMGSNREKYNIGKINILLTP